MAGTAALEFGVLQAHSAMTAEAGAHAFSAVEGHEAAVLLIASALHGMTAGVAAARRVGRLFFRRTVVTDDAAGLVMTGITGDVAVGAVIEGDRHAGRNFAAKHDGIFRILEIGLEVLSFRRRTPGEGEKKGKNKKRFHAHSPGR